MHDKSSTEIVLVHEPAAELPPILLGRSTSVVEALVGSFYGAVAEIFNRWVTRRESTHTQRAYRQDILEFVKFLESASVPDNHDFSGQLPRGEGGASGAG